MIYGREHCLNDYNWLISGGYLGRKPRRIADLQHGVFWEGDFLRRVFEKLGFGDNFIKLGGDL